MRWFAGGGLGSIMTSRRKRRLGRLAICSERAISRGLMKCEKTTPQPNQIPTQTRSAETKVQPWQDRSACPRRRRGRPSSPSTTSPSSELRLSLASSGPRSSLDWTVDFFGRWPKINLNAIENDWSWPGCAIVLLPFLRRVIGWEVIQNVYAGVRSAPLGF